MCDQLYANNFSLSGWYSRFLPSLTQKGKLGIKLHYFSGSPSLASNKESKKYLDEHSKTPFMSLEMISLHGWRQLGHGAVRSQGPLGATSESAVLWGGQGLCVRLATPYSCFCHYLAVWLWSSHLAFLFLFSNLWMSLMMISHFKS